jgi:asparagine synthase (glutamine-hydrolysing)
MAFAFRTYWQPGINLKRVPPWLNPSVSGACSAADAKDITRQHALGYMPSTLARGQTWWSILETVTTASIQLFPRYEFRFPYLDKDLVNFLFAIPPEQIQRPGRRRSLMRQALKGIVPLIVLERRRKAFINCSPRVALQQASQSIRRDLPFSPTVKVHAVQPRQFEGALDSLVKGTNVQWMTGVSRTIAFDLWMKSMAGFVQQESMRFDP